MKKFGFLFFLVFGLFIEDVRAQQTDCNNSLFVANNNYEAGKFSDALQLLHSCFDSISRDEKAGAVRLMGICYQMLQNQEYAYGYAKLLLQLRPDYMKYPFADPKEFTAQLNKFEVVPKVNWGLHFEVDQYAVRLIKLYTLAPVQMRFQGGIGFRGGIGLSYHLNRKYAVSIDPSARSMRYSVDLSDPGGYSATYSEIITTFEIPVNFAYHFKLSGNSCFLRMGMHENVLIRSFASMETRPFKGGEVVQSSSETTRYRRRFTHGAQFGIGTQYPFGKGSFALALNANIGLLNLTDPEKRYSNSNFILETGYIDSDFTLQAIGLECTWKLPVKYSVIEKEQI